MKFRKQLTEVCIFAPDVDVIPKPPRKSTVDILRDALHANKLAYSENIHRLQDRIVKLQNQVKWWKNYARKLEDEQKLRELTAECRKLEYINYDLKKQLEAK